MFECFFRVTNEFTTNVCLQKYASYNSALELAVATGNYWNMNSQLDRSVCWSHLRKSENVIYNQCWRNITYSFRSIKLYNLILAELTLESQWLSFAMRNPKV